MFTTPKAFAVAFKLVLVPSQIVTSGPAFTEGVKLVKVANGIALLGAKPSPAIVEEAVNVYTPDTDISKLAFTIIF